MMTTAADVARARARFDLLLNAAVGISWGPLLFHFMRHVVERGTPLMAAVTLVGTIGGGYAASRVRPGYFRLREWERVGRGRIYERYAGIRGFKRWMSDGDLMNAWLRRRHANYRVVAATRASAAAYAERTQTIERAHLAWFVGALFPMVYALIVGAIGFAALWTLVNLVTNAWPILLQRYNRARAEGIQPSPS